MSETWNFPNGVTYVIDEEKRESRTIFPDGTEVPARGNHDDDSMDRAEDLGYGRCDHPRHCATWCMSRDHELVHNLIAAYQGLPASRVLWGVAHPDEKPESWYGADEETKVFDVTRALIDAARVLEQR